MAIIRFILVVFMYLFIGSVVTGLIEPFDLEFFFVILWPIVVLVLVPWRFCEWVIDYTSIIKDEVRDWIRMKGTKKNYKRMGE